MSSSTNSGFASYLLSGPFPGTTAVRLVIGIYLQVNPDDHSWAYFIAASFYDRTNRVLWHRQICLVKTTHNSHRDWNAAREYDLDIPPVRTPLNGECDALCISIMS